MENPYIRLVRKTSFYRRLHKQEKHLPAEFQIVPCQHQAVSGKEKAAVRHLKVCRCRNRKEGTACRRGGETIPDG